MAAPCLIEVPTNTNLSVHYVACFSEKGYQLKQEDPVYMYTEETRAKHNKPIS